MNEELAQIIRAKREEIQPVVDATVGAFTCPKCGRTSYHPTDVKEGYCGACHDWTRS